MPEILSNLPNIALLWNEIAADLIRPEMKFFIFVAVLVVLIHGMLVLLIMTAFHQINKRNINRYQKQVDVLVYFSVVLLIFVSHLLDIFIWTYAMVNLEVFPSALKTFYFAGEMYTNLDHNDPSFKLGPEWNMLPILLSFSGLFAVAISGSALYTLLVSTFTKPTKDE
jgi:succinate dehydrogenase/fumarate reductase cytochrome b subunit